MFFRSSITPPVAIGFMLTCVVIYGGNFVITRHATLNGLTPSDLVALRFGTAGLILLPLFLRAGISNCAGVGWGRGMALAATSGVPMVLLMNVGLTLAPASHGASLQPGAVTLVGAIIGAVLARRVPPMTVLAGLAIVFTGLCAIAVAGSRSGGANVLLGDLCFLTGGALWGFYPFLLHRWKVPPMTATAVISVISLAVVPFCLLGGTRIFAVHPWIVVLNALNLGVLNMIIGLWLWGTALRVLGVPEAQRFPPLIPVAGTLIAIPVLGEIPSGLQWLGIVLICSGLALASLRSRSTAAKVPPTE